MKMLPLVFVLLVVSLSREMASPTPGYSVAIINKTGADFDNAAVRTASYAAQMGNVVNNGNVGYGLFHGKLPQAFVVEWSADDAQHRVAVELSKGVGEHFDGTIYFVIRPDKGVAVVPVRWGEAVPSFDAIASGSQ